MVSSFFLRSLPIRSATGSAAVRRLTASTATSIYSPTGRRILAPIRTKARNDSRRLRLRRRYDDFRLLAELVRSILARLLPASTSAPPNSRKPATFAPPKGLHNVTFHESSACESSLPKKLPSTSPTARFLLLHLPEPRSLPARDARHPQTLEEILVSLKTETSPPPPVIRPEQPTPLRTSSDRPRPPRAASTIRWRKACSALFQAAGCQNITIEIHQPAITALASTATS